MRWRFFDPKNQEEATVRNAIVARIDAWWEQFQANKKHIDALFAGKAEWDLPVWMDEHLQGIDSELMWEYGPAVHTKGHRLVITPEFRHHLRPLVAAILERAPKIKGWEFYDYRLPEDWETAIQSIRGRTGCDCSDFTVRINRGEFHRIDLNFSSPAFSDDNDPDANGAAFVATEELLGERCLDRWIGSIEFSVSKQVRRVAKASPSLSSMPIVRMKETVDALIGSLKDQLPEKPHYSRADGAGWTMWKLKPNRNLDDYPQQSDLFVGSSINPEMWAAAHGECLFYSERFSRCGETFCYVKLDGSEGLDEEKFADRSEIEDALDRVLRPAKLGCHIGGGTGLRYSYIDLALTDLDRGIEAVRKRLRKGNAPKRTWIQFFDADLAAEWVGIYEDTPPPPMRQDK